MINFKKTIDKLPKSVYNTISQSNRIGKHHLHLTFGGVLHGEP